MLHSELPDIVVPKSEDLSMPSPSLPAPCWDRTDGTSFRWSSVSGDKRLWLRLRLDGREFYAAPDGVDPKSPRRRRGSRSFCGIGCDHTHITAAYYA